MAAMGGAVHVFKPRSTGEGFGRSWYPPFNSGASAFFTLYAGAEMTCQEVRFIPVRFKDAYGPVGAWFLLFKSMATNAYGGNYMQDNAAELDKWEPYGKVKPRPANIRNWLMMLDVMDGKSPIYMQTADAIQRIAEGAEDEKLRQEEAEGAGVRGLGGLPGHDHLPGHPLGRDQRGAREEAVGDHGLRSLLHRLPLRRFRSLGVRSRGSPDSRHEGRVLLGLRQHDDGGRPVRRRRRLGSFQPQVLLRLVHRGPHRREGRHRLRPGSQRGPGDGRCPVARA